jgi:hypothetical protein
LIADQLVSSEVLGVAVQPGDSIGIIKGMVKKQCSPLLDGFSVLEMELYAIAKSKNFLHVATKWNTQDQWGTEKAPLLFKVNKIDLKLKGKKSGLLLYHQNGNKYSQKKIFVVC